MIRRVEFTCRTLQLIDKKLYILSDVYSFSYPKPIEEGKTGVIVASIKSLLILEVCNVKKLRKILEVHEVLA